MEDTGISQQPRRQGGARQGEWGVWASLEWGGGKDKMVQNVREGLV